MRSGQSPSPSSSEMTCAFSARMQLYPEALGHHAGHKARGTGAKFLPSFESYLRKNLLCLSYPTG